MLSTQNNLSGISDILVEVEETLVKELSLVFLSNENYAIKFEIFNIFEKVIDIDLVKSKPLSNLLLNSLNSFASYLAVPIDKKFKNEIVLTKQLIIDLIIYAFSRYKSSLQYWIKENKIFNKIIEVLNDNNKILALSVVKFIRSIFDYGDFFFCYDFVEEKLMKLLIELFNTNKKKDNAIFSAVCAFFTSLIEKENLLNQFVIMDRAFFYNGENYPYFENIIAKIERRPERPKPVIVDYNVKAKQEEEKKIDSEIVNEAKAAWANASNVEDKMLGKKIKNEESLTNIK